MADVVAEGAGGTNAPSLGILITTYRRVDYLRSCLSALASQMHPPQGIWIVYRPEDHATRRFLEALCQGPHGAGLHLLAVDRPGLIPAINRALPEIQTDIVCFIDDDAEAAPDWLARIACAFAEEPRLGALGGRDIMYRDGHAVPVSETRRIGCISPTGRLVGNHHMVSPVAGPRPVDYLKSVNMAFRRALLPPRLEPRLVGQASHFEVDLCLSVRKRGFAVVYDPDLLVRHDIGAPHYVDPVLDDAGIARDRLTAYLYNRSLIIGKHFGGLAGLWLLATHLLWHLPAYCIERKGMLGFLGEARLFYRAMLAGWRMGRNTAKTPALPLAGEAPEPVRAA